MDGEHAHRNVPRVAGARPATLQKAVDLLLALIGRLDGEDDGWQAQPYATVAYILWWLGDERALPMAVRALACDGKCSLAIIVASAIRAGIHPDWTNAE